MRPSSGPPARATTLKRESKDECCICHVLWFDSLAKREKTLLERTDSPIVIAGSAGLASSKELCYSCHDGYVADSRNAISKNNKHHLIGKVPDGLKLPDIFRLTKDNEFYCGTCHGFHDVRARGEVGQTPCQDPAGRAIPPTPRSARNSGPGNLNRADPFHSSASPATIKILPMA